MRHQAKIKLRSFLSGFFSAFDLSGNANAIEDRGTDISIYRHWRNVGSDIGRAARKFEKEIDKLDEHNKLDMKQAEYLRSQLREWHECSRSEEFAALSHGNTGDDCPNQENRLFADPDVTVKIDG